MESSIILIAEEVSRISTRLSLTEAASAQLSTNESNLESNQHHAGSMLLIGFVRYFFSIIVIAIRQCAVSVRIINAIYFFEMSVLFEIGELNTYVYDSGGLYRRKYV